MARVTVTVVEAGEIPVRERERLGLAADSRALVEVYEHHRPPSERHERDARDRALDEQWEAA